MYVFSKKEFPDPERVNHQIPSIKTLSPDVPKKVLPLFQQQSGRCLISSGQTYKCRFNHFDFDYIQYLGQSN